MKHDYLLLGEVVRPQGIHGEVKLRHYTDDPERFLELKTVYREREGRYEPIGVTGARVREDDVFLMLEGVRDRNAAEALRGVKLWVDRAHARELGEDEVYIADILGAEAYDTQGGRVGTLREVLTPGGVDVFVFDTPTGTLMAPFLACFPKCLTASSPPASWAGRGRRGFWTCGRWTSVPTATKSTRTPMIIPSAGARAWS